MGCFNSKPYDVSAIRRRPASIGEVAVFVPGLRVPEPLELPLPPLADSLLPRRVTERLAESRGRIAAMAAREALTVTRPWRRASMQHGGSTSADHVQVLEEYLPIVLGMTKYGSELEDKIQFAWMNQEDDAEETALPCAWYEVLSVLHMMAMLRSSQANSLLLPQDIPRGIPCQSI